MSAAATCIRCQRNPARCIRLCIPCWAIVVYGEADRLPPFPPLLEMLRRVWGRQLNPVRP